ncbi:MAG: class I SAM-dependent DNA methyltransferase [Planctomycetes bacterium]|nr:class I SAM-dependent DNA methyltransferase [Planctomycetota bacterium]
MAKPLSWNEIRRRAVAFSKQWAGESREHAEAKTFWDEFFKVFGLTRRHLASFEEPVKKISGSYGFIDLFWKGMLLAEHKSLGKDLGQAHAQAMEYIQSLQREDRGDEVPRYVIVSDFARIALHDLEDDSSIEIPLTELHEHVHHFGFIPGYKRHKLEPEDPINIKAVQIMGDLHDALEAGGYSGHELERLLVRVLFCLFAEDTGIFERNAFQLYLENHTQPDGSDLGPLLAQFFQVLNKPETQRQANLREELAELPYVNGDLFAEALSFAAFDRDMRNRLVACTRFDWSRISPAVFGALFQAVMEPRERRQIGAHYTSERDILKVIGPLFLDDLKTELDKAKNDKNKLRKLHARLADMRLLDPACGCGNFLVISYREMRVLELEILRRLLKRQQITDIETILKLDVGQMYGIEIEEWPVRIAEVAMWLMDHQMNQRLSEEFGEYFVRLPLRTSPHIHHGNALRVDWNEILPASECTHVLGNPPFVGKKEQTRSQKADLEKVWGDTKGTGILDYVTCWYRQAAEFIQGTTISVAFVSTNSISQGEQVAALWEPLNQRFRMEIEFAHRTFAWQSEARGKAHVHCVIIGFGQHLDMRRRLFEYEHLGSDPHETVCSNINAYLTDAPSVFVTKRRKPINGAPPIRYGSMMIDKDRKARDDQGLILSPQYRKEMLEECPELAPFIRRLYGGDEFLNDVERWCLWLVDAPPQLLRSCKSLRVRLKGIKSFRSSSSRKRTQELAATPHLFGEIRQPDGPYLLIPKVSSFNRRYIPSGFLTHDNIASGSALIVPDAQIFHFGVISSAMHHAWMTYVAGRMKSDYQYSNAIVYNNYPWPQKLSDKKRQTVEDAAQAVLDVRETHPDATLADLYDPLSMPTNLTKAHAKLDRAVDRCYRSQPFPNERNRVEYLFKLYQKLTAPLLPVKKRK